MGLPPGGLLSPPFSPLVPHSRLPCQPPVRDRELIGSPGEEPAFESSGNSVLE